ncbi:MAG TPA: tripartite tricarboxylate transporter substrate binding protein [Alphaproteobacteria bacterium]|nr:tripartite tricarboxylate transporter substrate binding protein [Alphaproteobacteria bacterium]
MLTRSLALGAAFAIAFAIDAADAQTKYPHSTVTLVTHSSPGGGSDVFLRELAKHLGPAMGVNFVVENVRGGSGARAVAKVAQAPADGSIFYATTPTYIQTTLLSKPEYGYETLEPLMIVFLDPEVVYTRSQSPFKTLAEAVNDAKQNPGKAKWGAANPASLERIAFERLSRLTGVRAAVVTHEGGGDLMINVLNGTLDIGIGEIQEIRAQLDAGQVRLLATLTDARLDQFPNLTTAREQGIDLTVTKFRGLAGPKGLSAEVIKAWEEGMQKVLASAAYKKEYERENLVPAFMGHAKAGPFTAEFAKEVTASLREFGVVK